MIVTAGALSATFLPDLGMTGVSLRCRGREHLALPGGLRALRTGATLGLPLLAPWANRLGSRRYRAAGVDVDLDRPPARHRHQRSPDPRSPRGQTGMASRSPIGRRATGQASGPRSTSTRRRSRSRTASRSPSSPTSSRLALDTTVIPTGRRRVPVAFGWHPYLRLPGTPRSQWHLRLPSRTHLALDERRAPDGSEQAERHGRAEPIGRRTFDDLYLLGRERRLALVAEDESSITLPRGPGYPYAQVWVPAGRPFAALEPMTAATNSLVDGTTPLVEPGDTFTARFPRIGTADEEAVDEHERAVGRHRRRRLRRRRLRQGAGASTTSPSRCSTATTTTSSSRCCTRWPRPSCRRPTSPARCGPSSRRTPTVVVKQLDGQRGRSRHAHGHRRPTARRSPATTWCWPPARDRTSSTPRAPSEHAFPLYTVERRHGAAHPAASRSFEAADTDPGSRRRRAR